MTVALAFAAGSAAACGYGGHPNGAHEPRHHRDSDWRDAGGHEPGGRYHGGRNRDDSDRGDTIGAPVSPESEYWEYRQRLREYQNLPWYKRMWEEEPQEPSRWHHPIRG